MKLYVLACVALVVATWIASIVTTFPNYREMSDSPVTGFFYLLVEDYFIIYLQHAQMKLFTEGVCFFFF